MVKPKSNKKFYIGVGIALMIILVFIFGVQMMSYPSGAILASEDTYIEQRYPSDTYGGSTSTLYVGWDFVSSTSQTYQQITFLKFNIPQTTIDEIMSGASIMTADLYLYIYRQDDTKLGICEAPNTWSESSLTWNNAPLRSCTKQITSTQVSSVEDDYIRVAISTDYIASRLGAGETQVSFALVGLAPDMGEDDEILIKSRDYGITKSPYLYMELSKPIVCTEDEIKQFSEQFHICKLGQWINIQSVVDLSEAEQQRLLDLISSLELTKEQQIKTITDLQLNISQQAIWIDELNKNLGDKIAAVSLLVVNNEEQLKLYNLMELSFEDQLELIGILGEEISDDKRIIESFNLSLEQEGIALAKLRLETDEALAIAAELRSDITERDALIASYEAELAKEGTISQVTDDVVNLVKTELVAQIIVGVIALVFIVMIILLIRKRRVRR